MKGCFLPLTNLDKILIVLIEQTFARCFTRYCWGIVATRISHLGGTAAEARFGTSVAHNNHKIGVNP